MNWRINIVFILFIFFGCKQQTIPNDMLTGEAVEIAPKSYLIEVDELFKKINESNIKIIDFRKNEFYSKEHIIGALNVWRTDIEDASYRYKGMMASKEHIEDLFSNLGIDNDDTIIIYDDNGLCDSSRLWWILQNYDFTNVKMLHGGITDWKLKGGLVSAEKPKLAKTVFKLPEKTSMRYFVSKEDMLKSINRNTVILDTRTEDEFSGKRQKKGAANAGRIPNSKLIDWSRAIDYHGDKKIKPVEELESIYNDFASKQDTIIVYCHSGVRSAHTTFILTQLLGYKNVKNYDGSWTEWSYFNNLPIEKDSITTIKK